MSHYVIANWKLNLDHDSALEWLVEFKKKYKPNPAVKVGIAPSHTEIPLVRDFLKNWNLESEVDLSCQNVSKFSKGRYTGEIGAYQLANYEVDSCIVGHSERRLNFKETSLDIIAKVQSLRENNILPVIAVSSYEQIDDLVKANILNQPAVVAYEPVESIGTGNPADPLAVEKLAEYVLKNSGEGQVQVMYGGSVDSESVKSFLKIKSIQGFLVGTASEKADTFVTLLKSINGNNEK